MKRILAMLLVLMMVVAMVSCGKKNQEVDTNAQNQQEVIENQEEVNEPAEEPEQETDSKQEVEEEKKPQATESNKKPEQKPEVKPEQKPESTPTPAPEEKPAQKQSVGNTLLAAFKASAASKSAMEIAETLVANPVIAFSGGAAPVEPGLLTGFGNTEITGFEEGAMFAPMIGTIPFIGYVFTLSDASQASSLIATLKANADLRWNICTSADEMVAGSSGNKVFFVMSPISFEEE
ncbi:MAG: hypothetical protein IJB80_00595 [Clostridia bacterium]|nr:hypothetical protein [Clostridia bacterium]